MLHTIADGSAVEIALAYRDGRAGPVALVECLLERIRQTIDHHIFIAVTCERALSQAEASQKRYARGMPLSILDGVPVAWKDLFDVAGARTTAGSKLLAESPVKDKDMPCAANLNAAGMVTLGKVNMAEFAYAPLGLNRHFGTPRNPHDPITHRIPGGSSSGSGAAVGARLVPCAIGTDTGGSVRIPAAFNGVVGFETSTGRIDTTGLIPLARSFDTIGPLARSVEDCILIDALLRKDIASTVQRLSLRSLTLLVPTNVVGDDAEHHVLVNYERTIDVLAARGATIRRERVKALDGVVEMTAAYGTLIAAEAYAEYRDLIDSERAALMDPRLVERLKEGKRMGAGDVIAIQRERQRLISLLHDEMQDALLCMPTVPLTAPALAPLEADDALLREVNRRTVGNASLGNNLDMCGLALPNGFDDKGLPTSFLLSACHGDDARLLDFGLEVERALHGIAGKR